jgi:glycosyltransferase involved in cell wall biosynthesis
MKKQCLIIGNGGLTKINTSVYINRHSGKFLDEVNKKHKVIYSQYYHLKNDINQNILDYDLAISGISLFIRKHKFRNRLFYLIDLIKYCNSLTKQTRNTDYVYFFYPSTISKLLIPIFILKGIDYGCYLRGDVKGSFFNRFLLKHASLICSTTIFYKNLFTHGNYSLIRPMVDSLPDSAPSSLMPLKERELNVLFVGRLEKDKGIYELVKSIIGMRSYEDRFNFHIVGGGDKYGWLTGQVKQYKLNNLKTYGFVKDEIELANLYRQADIFVLPTYHEGFPRVILEAMSYGVPVITTIVGGMRGIMKDKFNCLEIKPKNHKDLIDKLVYALNNYSNLTEIRLSGYNTYMDIINRSPHSSCLVNHIK